MIAKIKLRHYPASESPVDFEFMDPVSSYLLRTEPSSHLNL